MSSALRTAFSLRIDVAPDTMGCSITEIDGGRYRTPVWSNELAIELDHSQYDAGAGPCIDAARQQRAHSWGASDLRYPFYAEAALQRGVFSTLSIPLQTGAQPAALNLYGGAAETFHGTRPRAVADLLARCIGRLLLDTAAGSVSDADAGHHGRPTVPATASTEVDVDALASARSQHEQVVRAQHALMSERGLSAQDAFAVLSELSRTQRRRIADVARSMLEPTAHEEVSDV